MTITLIRSRNGGSTLPISYGNWPPGQFWVKEGLAKQWGVAPESLGYLEAGIGMSVENAVRLAEAGKSNLIPYARRTFEAVDQQVTKITDEMLLMPSYSVIPEFKISAKGVFKTTVPMRSPSWISSCSIRSTISAIWE